MQEKLFHLLILNEGLRFKPYKDSLGNLTIGIGRNLDANGLSKEEVRFLAMNDIESVRSDLNRVFPWYSELCDARRAVIEDMCFNMGISRLRGFKNFFAAVKDRNWDKAVDEMFDSRWAFQVGDGPGKIEDRVDRLAKMMKTGEWPAEILT